MATYKGLLTQVPVADAGLPEPYATGTAQEKQAYEQSAEGKAQYWNNFQLINNHTAIASGNKASLNAINKYNSEVKFFYDNGGAAKGYSLPVLEDLHLEQYYTPAVDATSFYVPPANGQPGKWVPNPNPPKVDVPVWSLPEGTVLYTVNS